MPENCEEFSKSKFKVSKIIKINFLTFSNLLSWFHVKYEWHRNSEMSILWEIHSHWEILHEIKTYLVTSLVSTLYSRNFCQKVVWEQISTLFLTDLICWFHMLGRCQKFSSFDGHSWAWFFSTRQTQLWGCSFQRFA